MSSRNDFGDIIVQPLERRQLLTITPGENGVVFVVGDNSNNDVIVRLAPADPATLQVYDGAQLVSFVRSSVRAVSASGLAGDDRFFVDNQNGFVTGAASALSIRFDGDDGFDRVILSGDPRGSTNNRKGTYVPGDFTGGSAPGSGTITTRDGKSKQSVFFFTCEDVVDRTPARTLTVSANDQANVIQVRRGSATSDGTTFGQVDIFDVELCQNDDHRRDDNDEDDDDDESENGNQNRELILQGTYVPILFANKRSLQISALAGSDFIDLHVQSRPSGLKTISVDGGHDRDELTTQRVARGVKTHRGSLEVKSDSPRFTLVEECRGHEDESGDDHHDDDEDDDGDGDNDDD